jgi:immune inhibitor A
MLPEANRQTTRMQNQDVGKILGGILVGCLLAFSCLACSGIVASAGLIVGGPQFLTQGANYQDAPQAESDAREPSPLPPVSTPSGTAIPPQDVNRPEIPTPFVTELPRPDPLESLSPPREIEQEVALASDSANLNAMLEANFPPRDYYEDAIRLGSIDPGERIVPSGPYQIGDRQYFITDDGEPEAELMAITDHTYFWVERGLDLDQKALIAAANRFEEEYYPIVSEQFGHEWRPGVDDDPHFSVLHLESFSGNEELGFFDSSDEYPQSISGVSNEQEIVYLNMENLRIGEDLYFGTLVHELQHLSQWHHDGNESVWFDEALAQLAEEFVGLDTVEWAEDYLLNPDTQLNSWPFEDEETIFAHYGASYLFALYLWEQLGDQAVAELARHPANGLASVHAMLASFRPDLTLDQFVGDWVVANYLDDPAAGGRYSYENVNLPRPAHAVGVGRLPSSSVQKVNQYGVHYVSVEAGGQATISFAGDTLAELVPSQPRSGRYMWFTPSTQESNAQLTASFDLTGLESAILSFWAWYDLEEDFDFGYISISADDGENWDLLTPVHLSAGEFGPAISGQSWEEADNVNGWVQESIKLDTYTGRPVLIRIEALTYSGNIGSGFAVDDIAIPELNYANDVETLEDGWQANGFVRSGSRLPQQWSLHLIQPGSSPMVTPLQLDERNQGVWSVDLGDEGGVLAIAALTPFISEPASYWLQIEP